MYNEFIDILNYFKFSNIDVPINYHKNRLFAIKSLLTSLALLLMFTLFVAKYIVSSTQFFTFMEIFILFGGVFITNLAITIFLKCYQMLILSVRMKYKLINRILKKNFLLDRIQIQKIIIIKSTDYNLNSLIEQLARIHDGLGEILDKINFCYSFQVCSWQLLKH